MNEAQTRKDLIDKAIETAGWTAANGCQVLVELSACEFAPGRAGKVRGKPLAADYILTYRGRRLVVVEAKRDEERVRELLGKIEPMEKTIIFCYSQPHAMEIMSMVNKFQKTVEPDGWIRAEGVGRLDETMFVVRADGHSMEPPIADGDLCVMRRMGGGDWENKIALVAYRGPEEDGLAAYALKKVTRSSGGVMLSPINPDYAPFEVSDSAEYGTSYLLGAEFKAVLFRKKELSFA